jgi:hypothetical protein
MFKSVFSMVLDLAKNYLYSLILPNSNKGCVTVAMPFTVKKYLKSKEEL